MPLAVNVIKPLYIKYWVIYTNVLMFIWYFSETFSKTIAFLIIYLFNTFSLHINLGKLYRKVSYSCSIYDRWTYFLQVYHKIYLGTCCCNVNYFKNMLMKKMLQRLNSDRAALLSVLCKCIVVLLWFFCKYIVGVL